MALLASLSLLSMPQAMQMVWDIAHEKVTRESVACDVDSLPTMWWVIW